MVMWEKIEAAGWGSWISFGAILVFTFIIFNVAKAVFKKVIARKNDLVTRFLRSLVLIVIAVTGIYSAFAQFNITSKVAGAFLTTGSITLTLITLAAQKSLENITGGFFLSLSKPFEIGQKIKIQEGGSVIAEGYVRDITLRHTVIETYAKQAVIIPNSVVDKAVIVNDNLTEQIGSYLEFEVAFDTDLAKAREIIASECYDNPLTVYDKKPNVFNNRFSANGVVLKVLVTTDNIDDSFKAASAIREAVLKRFNEEGIEIPYQTLTLNQKQKLSR